MLTRGKIPSGTGKGPHVCCARHGLVTLTRRRPITENGGSSVHEVRCQAVAHVMTSRLSRLAYTMVPTLNEKMISFTR